MSSILFRRKVAGLRFDDPWEYGLVEARLKAFRHSTVDRSALLDRVRRRYDAAEWTADFAGVADELQKMARDDLRRHLIDNGMPTQAAEKVVAGYSIGALLGEP